MGTDSSKNYNNKKILSINIESDRVCYFPGEFVNGAITIFPRLESIFQLICEPQLNIKINQRQQYRYSTGSGKNRHTVFAHEEITLATINVNFEKIISMDYSSGFKIPFSIQIPMDTYPSIFIGISSHVKHLLIVEFPQVEAARTKIIVIKNNFPPNIGGLLYKQPYEEVKEIDKSKFFVKKGSVLLNIKLPKNYFFYNEKIPFEVNIDTSKMELIIKSIIISLVFRGSYNWKNDHSSERRGHNIILNEKTFNLEKDLKNQQIKDYIDFPISSKYYAPNVYTALEQHGLFEMKEQEFNYFLYPSACLGLISINYSLQLKLNFESSIVTDEAIKIPIYFSSNTDGININQD